MGGRVYQLYLIIGFDVNEIGRDVTCGMCPLSGACAGEECRGLDCAT